MRDEFLWVEKYRPKTIEDWSYELEETEETGIGNISNDNAGTSKHALFDA